MDESKDWKVKVKGKPTLRNASWDLAFDSTEHVGVTVPPTHQALF